MLRGSKIILRPIQETDIKKVIALSNDFSETGPYWPLHPFTEQTLRCRYQDSSCWEEHSGLFLIVSPEDEILGHINFFKSSPYMAGYEIGYRLYKKADRGKGYGTEALALFSAYLFSIKAIPFLMVTAIEGNQASRRIAEKCGYRHIGTFPSFVFHRGAYHNLDMLSLERENALPLEKLTHLLS